MPTALYHNINYLKRLLTHALAMHRPTNIEEATMLADVRDYFMYLTLDALSDPALARTLVGHFTQLGLWLESQAKDTPVWREEHLIIRFYVGFVFALKHLLSVRHEIALLPAEKISREAFTESWKRTAAKLGL